MWALRAILVLVVVIVVVAIALHNVGPDQKVDVNLIWKTYVGVALVEIFLWSFAIGVFVALLVFISVYIRLVVNLRSVRKQVRALESEVTVLRNRPIEESGELLKKNNSGSNALDSPFDTRE